MIKEIFTTFTKVKYMKVIGLMVKSMETADILIKMVIFMRANGE